MVRSKNRYLAIEVNEPGVLERLFALNEAIIYRALINKVQELHGDFGEAAIRQGFTVKYCNEYTKVAIVRVRRGPHRLVASVIPLIRSLDKKDVSIRTLYTCATIRQCFYFIQGYQQRKFDEFCKTLRSEEEIEKLRRAMKEFESLILKLK